MYAIDFKMGRRDAETLKCLTEEQEQHVKTDFYLLGVPAETVPSPPVWTDRHGIHCAWYARQESSLLIF